MDEDVTADDGCATVWVVLSVDMSASFLDLRPDEDEACASSSELDVVASVDFASSFVDDVGDDSVLTVSRVGVPTLPASSPLEAPDVEAEDVDADDVVDEFDSEDFESADEDLEESD